MSNKRPFVNLGHPFTQTSKLSDNDFDQLRKLIYKDSGIFFPESKKYLVESRVVQRLKAVGLTSFEDYVEKLYNGLARSELKYLINAVTINETFFFRHGTQLDALGDSLIPELIRKKRDTTNRKIRIWSAACSTGDEPYSVAMIVKDRLIPQFPDFQFEITGTDINSQILEKARHGTFGEYAVRNLPKPYRTRYVRKKDGKFVLDPEIRRMVTFQEANLVKRSLTKLLKHFDIILCANVLIYFDPESKKVAVSGLYDALNHGGYLLLSPSESLYGLTQAFRPVHLGKVVAYRKE